MAVPARGQDGATARRDRAECQARAADDVGSPVLAGLGTKIGMSVGGAVLGGGVVLAGVANSPGGPRHAEAVGMAVGGGAAVGFVFGSVVGTFKGAQESMRAVSAREHIFGRCMTERG